ncbi:hypothetical protein BG004_003758 [Podila humilis]|nr:hypothetical protein BG004_003758 [Podila humilis]
MSSTPASSSSASSSSAQETGFQLPIKRIKDEAKDLPFFQTSEAYARIMSYILALNTAVFNKKVSTPLPASEPINRIVALLDTLDSWIDLVPPRPDPQRFGNLAFRDYVHMFEDKAPSLLEAMLPADLHPAVVEITPYLTQSMGHGTRIDYGSGHELSFVAWLCCLEIIGFLHGRDHTAVVLTVFVRYLELVRKLQRTYQLEPAGSHGVWGLDDYQFLPYLWGSAQLRDNTFLKPIAIMTPHNLEDYSDDYMYFRAIQWIHQTKRGPFHEHSPVLFEISGVQLWSKVNSGMIKMYKAEVLNKFPVVQHLLFGSLLPWRASDTPLPSSMGPPPVPAQASVPGTTPRP